MDDGYRPDVGETVQIVNTGHPATDAAGHLGKVVRLCVAEGYAVLATLFGSGEYRAAWSEMVPVGKPVSKGFYRNGAAKPRAPAVRANGYNGPPCDTCGGYNLTPSGSCYKCDDCGSSSGCS